MLSSRITAWNLSKENIKILCLEQGSYFKKSEYLENNKKLDRDLDVSPNVRKSKFDYPIDESNSDIGIANFNSLEVRPFYILPLTKISSFRF